jgi:hypothetical protein
MPIPVTCSCGAALRAPDRAAGKAVRCPACAQVVRVPAAGAAIAPITVRTGRTQNPGGGTDRIAAGPAARSARGPGRRAAPAGTPWLLIGGIAGAAVATVVVAVLVLGGGDASNARSMDPLMARTSDGGNLGGDVQAPRAAAPPAPTPASPPTSSAPFTDRGRVAPAVAARGGDYAPPAVRVEANRLFLAGSGGQTRLLGGLALSNGDLLLCGGTDDLGWTGSAPRTEFPATGITRVGGDRYGFILQLSGDLATIKRVYHFPKGVVESIGRLRSTEVPGQPTGELYLSAKAGSFSSYKDDGYLIARMDGNGVDAPPTAPRWVYEVKAGERDAIGFNQNGWRPSGQYVQGDYTGDAYNAHRQPWDVRNDGGVVYVVGVANDFSWSAMHVLNADGRPDGMPGWGPRGDDGANFITLKVPNGGPLRSSTAEEFALRQVDENGNPGRKGARPNDVYFSSHDSPHGPGYTGYQRGASHTHRVGEVVIDRRTNHLYFGYNQASRLPEGNPDFEPALVAMDEQGALKWWARGYQEFEAPPELGKADHETKHQWTLSKLSPPDQYFDHLAIDYAGNRLIATGRAHGGGNINFWNGDKIRANTGRPGFQRGFTGTRGDIHYCWMGAYDLDRLRITAATYVAEYADDLGGFKPIPSGPVAGWPDPNHGWINLNSTFLHGLAIDPRGRPLLVGIGKRPITSGDALIRNPTPTGGNLPIPAWAPFARAYDADLGGIAYSTLVRGPWDTGSGRDDDKHDVEMTAIIALQGGFLALARHVSGPAGGSSLPTTAVPAWGAARAPGRTSAVVALIRTP